MRRLLHSALDFESDSRYAPRQARRGEMHPIDGGKPLPTFRLVRASDGLLKPPAERIDVPGLGGRSDGSTRDSGEPNNTIGVEADVLGADVGGVLLG